MVTFSVGEYNITVFVGQVPDILDYYKKHASSIYDSTMQTEGTEVYVIISKGFLKVRYVIVAFKTHPIGYAGFCPEIHYELETNTLFIGAGSIIKTLSLNDHKIVFEKDHGFGFWGWNKYENFLLQQEETAFGVFDLHGKQLWEAFVMPPYDFEIIEDRISLKFDEIIDTRLLLTGKKL